MDCSPPSFTAARASPKTACRGYQKSSVASRSYMSNIASGVECRVRAISHDLRARDLSRQRRGALILVSEPIFPQEFGTLRSFYFFAGFFCDGLELGAAEDRFLHRYLPGLKPLIDQLSQNRLRSISDLRRSTGLTASRLIRTHVCS